MSVEWTYSPGPGCNLLKLHVKISSFKKKEENSAVNESAPQGGNLNTD